MWNLIIEMITSIFRFGEKVTPTDKMRETKQEIKKPLLEAKVRQRMVKESKVFLDLHLRQSVDAHIEVKYPHLEEEDRHAIRTALYELFPKRKHKKP